MDYPFVVPRVSAAAEAMSGRPGRSRDGKLAPRLTRSASSPAASRSTTIDEKETSTRKRATTEYAAE
jgi:hypothetical protein